MCVLKVLRSPAPIAVLRPITSSSGLVSCGVHSFPQQPLQVARVLDATLTLCLLTECSSAQLHQQFPVEVPVLQNTIVF